MEKEKEKKKEVIKINKQIIDQLKTESKNISNIQGLVTMIDEERIARFDRDEYLMIDIIRSIIEKSSSLNSFLIMDMGNLFDKYKQWRSLLPNVEIYYAVKCCPDKILLKTLAYLGVGFDVASKAEISMINDLGVPSDKMIFANPVKENDHIMYARSMNVDVMTFDNEDELKKISIFHPKANLVLRILVDDSKAKLPFGSKFGCPLNNMDNVFTLAKLLKLNLVGVSFHVGSSCMDPTSYSGAMIRAREVFKLAEKYGYKFNLLDLGGGYPGHEDEHVRFENIANEINTQLELHFSDVENLKVLAEPGRFFATRCGTLVTNVIGKKQVNIDGEQIFHYYINSNLYGVFNNLVFDKAIPTFSLINRYKPETYRSTIFGQTCDSMDKIAENLQLPELALGDWIYVINHGAYTIAAGSTFNGFSLAEIKYIYSYTNE